MLNRTSGWLVFIVRLRSVSRCRRKLHMVFAVGTENGSRSFGVSRPALLLFAHGQVSGGRFAAIHGRTAGGGAVGAGAFGHAWPPAGADPSDSHRGRPAIARRDVADSPSESAMAMAASMTVARVSTGMWPARPS